MAVVTGRECPRQRKGWQGDQRVFDFSIRISKEKSRRHCLVQPSG